MALLDIIKSWFGRKSKAKTPAPSPVIIKKAPIAPTPPKTPQTKVAATPAKTETTPVKIATIQRSSENSGQSLFDIVNSSAQFSIREIALAKIDDQTQLADIVCKHSIAKIRQQAAHQLTDLSIMATTAEKVKHSDKGVYKILRKKVDAANATLKADKQQQLVLEKICADLDAQSRLSLNPLFAAKVQSLQQQWQQATHTKPANALLSERYQQALSVVTTLLHEQSSLLQASNSAAQQHAEIKQQLEVLLNDIINNKQDVGSVLLKQNLDTINEQWQQLSATQAPEPLIANAIKQLQQQLSALQQLFENSQEHLPAFLALTAELTENPLNQQAYDTLKQQLKPLGLSKIHALPPVFASIKTALLLAESALTAQSSAVSAAVKNEKNQQEQAQHVEFSQLITQLETAFDEGHTHEASQLLRTAQQLAKKHHIQEPRLTEWSQELHKLKEWAGFAIIPKKEALVAAMAQLAETEVSDADGLSRLDDIKALQAEWQAVGMVNNDAERALWQQFKDLNQTAYLPCQRYFDQQNAIQAQNATNRTALCDELQSYLELMPQDINWQVHIAIIKKAREDWQLHHPVEAKVHKKLQHRFNSIIKTLEDKLNAEYALQESRKSEIIVQAEQLLQLDNVRDACQQAKNLQGTWKTIPSCGHAKDQVLWEKFRQHCDAVFNKREQLKQSQNEEEALAMTRANELLAQFDELLTHKYSSANNTVIQEITQSFDKLHLPRELNHELRNKLSDFKTQWQAKIHAQREQEKQGQRAQVVDALQLCLDVEQQMLAGTPISLSQALTWQSLQLPAFFKPTLTKRWQSLSSLVKKKADERLDAFNNGCLLLELLLDTDSSEAHQAARTAKKIELFGQQSYPKTDSEKHALIQQTLTAVLSLALLPTESAAQANARLIAIIQNPQLAALV